MKWLSPALVRWLEPRPLWRLGLTLLCTPALSYIFLNSLEQSALAYPIYVLSAYTLTLWVVWGIGAFSQARAIIHRHPLGRQYLTDASFRGQLSLHLSTGINLCYALFKMASGVYYRSIWFGALAIYYLILSVARGILLRSIYQKEPNRNRELKTVRLCAWLLPVLNLALSALVMQMVTDGKGYAYPGSLIFVVALYAFYSVISSTINLIRFRKLHDPVLSMSKLLGVATALASMLSLQTAMFASFGGDYAYQQLMNALTGGGVCLLLFVMAIVMLIKTNRALKNKIFRSNRRRNK